MKRICSVNVHSDGLGIRNRIFGYINLESAKKWLNSTTVESYFSSFLTCFKPFTWVLGTWVPFLSLIMSGSENWGTETSKVSSHVA